MTRNTIPHAELRHCQRLMDGRSTAEPIETRKVMQFDQKSPIAIQAGSVACQRRAQQTFRLYQLVLETINACLGTWIRSVGGAVRRRISLSGPASRNVDWIGVLSGSKPNISLEHLTPYFCFIWVC